MFTPSEIGINPTVCISSGSSGSSTSTQVINRNFQTINNILNQISNGVGAVLRFKLLETLDLMGSAAATIERFDGTEFVEIGEGVVHDEEIDPGLWSGEVDEEGWCTARDLQEGHYSIVFMPLTLQSQGKLLRFNNASGEEVPTGAVMRITATTFASGKPYYTIGKPNGTFQRQYLVNTGLPVPDGSDGHFGSFLCESGRVLYDTGTPALNQEWGAKSGQWSLSANRPGFFIEGGTETISGSGTVVVARQHLVTEVLAKSASSIANAATPTMTVQGGTPGSESGIGMTISSCYNPGRYLYPDELCKVNWEGEKPYLSPANGSPVVQGVSTGAMTAGGSAVTVNIYTPGGTANTDTLSAKALLVDVASGKAVYCAWIGSGYFVLNAAPTTTTVSVLTDMRMKSGNTQIEAEAKTLTVVAAGSGSYSDKVSVSSCP